MPGSPRRRRPPAKQAPSPRRPPAKQAPSRPRQELLQHELLVHQEELRAQNEKLIAARETLEEARDRYIELYDLAPNGYMTLDVRGFVREINLSALALLGAERSQVVGLPILRFIAESDRQPFLKYLNVCRLYKSGEWPIHELSLQTPAGRRMIQITCRPRASRGSRASEFFAALVDVTLRRRLEAEREAARRQNTDLVRQMMSLQEHERRRIARDIHDDLGQQITGLRLKLEWLAGIVAGDPPLRASVEGVQQVAERLDRHVDFLLRHLRPAGLDDVGLVAALEQTVQKWSETFGIPAEFHAAGDNGERLPADTEGHLYRIVQEALNNVHKHAAARQVVVSLERSGARTSLMIRDDGTGIDGSAAESDGRRGLGLIGMRERAGLIGARFEILSLPGRGTTVFVELP
jgi:PAS domain S-box-containing protein